jgi:hypothetical protein
MEPPGEHDRRRVYVPQALGSEEFLRVTWHERRGVIVFSHWEGARCLGATPIRVADVGELAELIVTALARGRTPPHPVWAPPRPDELVVTHLPTTQSA